MGDIEVLGAAASRWRGSSKEEAVSSAGLPDPTLQETTLTRTGNHTPWYSKEFTNQLLNVLAEEDNE